MTAISGNIANFYAQKGLPLRISKANIDAVQEPGTPTPDSPKAIHGVSELHITRCSTNLVNIKKPFSELEVSNYYAFLMNCVPNTKINATLIDKDPSIDLSDISFGFVDSNWDKVHALQTTQYRWVVQMGVPATNKSNTSVYNTDIILTGLIFYPNTEEVYNKVMARYDIEFELETANTYEPFNGTSQVIQLGNTYYGGYVTQDKSGRRQLVVTHEVKIIDNTANISQTSSAPTSGNGFIITSSGIDYRYDYADYKSNYYGNGVTTAISNMNLGDFKIYPNESTQRVVVIDNVSTVEALKEKYRTQPLQIVYKIADPIIIDLPDGEPITSLAGVNNVYASSGSVEIDVPNYFKCASIHATQNSNVVIDTASGSIANFETQLAMPLLDAQIDVNAVQDLHGQSGAYPPGGSAQKWDEEWLNGYLSSTDGSYISDANAICSKNFTEIQANTNYFLYKASSVPNTYICWYDVDQLFISRELVNNSVVASPNNAKYFKVSSYGYGTSYNNNISINYPSTDTAYHPYSNICPINGWDEIKVGYVDFNQLSLPATTGRAWQGITFSFNDGIYELSGEGTNIYSNITQKINPIINNVYLIGKIIVANPNNVSFGWSFLNASKTPYVPGSSDTQWSVVKVVTQNGPGTGISGFDVGTNFTGVKFKIVCINLTQALGKEKADYIHSLPNYGVDAARKLFTKDYYPYNEGGTLVSLSDVNGKVVCPVDAIQLNNTYYGGHFTQDKAGHRQFVVTHGIKSFSDIAFNYSNNAGQWQHFLFYGAINDKLSTSLTLLCTNYEVVNEQLSTISNEKMLVASWGNYIYIRDDAYTTVEDFKTANANTQVVYTLETPIIIDLPDGEPIITLNGTNNIFADTGDTAVKFRKIGE